MAQYDSTQVRRCMQSYYEVLSTSKFENYCTDQLSLLEKVSLDGNQVPEELRDDAFTTALSFLDTAVLPLLRNFRALPRCVEIAVIPKR